MTDSKIISLNKPEQDPLNALLKQGAQQLLAYDLPVCFVQIARVPRKNGAVSNNLGNDLSLEDLT